MAGVTSGATAAPPTEADGALPDSPVRRRPVAVDGVLVLTVAVAAFLRFYRIGSQSLWFDEYFTTTVVATGKSMLGIIAHQEGTPPLYFVLLKVWQTVLGNGDGMIRSLSALAGTLTIPVAYAAARELTKSRRVARVAAVLVAFNPMLVWFSQEARAYSLLVFLGSVSLLCCIRARQRGRTSDLVFWGIASAAAVSTHYFAVFLILPEAVWLIVALRDRWRSVAWGFLPMVAIAPYIYFAFYRYQRKANLQNWIPGTPLRFRYAESGRQALMGPGGWDDRLWIVAAAVVLLAAVLVVVRGDKTERRLAGLMVAIGATGLVLPWIAALFSNDFVLPRNAIASLVPFGIAAGIGLGARRAGWVGAAGTLVLCALSAAIVLTVATDPLKQRADWRAVAKRLDRGSGERLVVIDHDGHLAMPMVRYFHHARSLRRGEVIRVHQIDLVYHVSAAGGRCALFQGRPCDSALSLFPTFPNSLSHRFVYSGKPKIGDFEVNLYRSAVAQPVGLNDFRRPGQRALLVLVVD